MSNWQVQYIIARTPAGEALGVVTITRPDDASTLELSILNKSGEILDLMVSTCASKAEYETMLEFDVPELEIVKESLSNTGMNYTVLLRKAETDTE